MKKALLFVLTTIVILVTSACEEKCTVGGCNEKVYQDGYCEHHYSMICKAENCEDDVYKDGYCKYHYTVHSVNGVAKDVFNGFFGE